jgi:hypothetical protein
MHKVSITSSAQTDLLNGFKFYEAHEVGIGGYFLQCLMADIDALALYGGIHTKSYSGFYRSTSKRFPFSIYDQFDGDTVTVAAVLEARLNPKTYPAHGGQST